MSLKDLKNTLKACTASSSSLSASSFSQVRSEEEAQEQVKRKPPKTSLKQQLKSLGEIATDLHVNGGDYTLFDTQNECPQKDNCGEQSPKINNEEDDEGYECFREERESGDVVFLQPFTEGPFEPLILGECPNTGLITQLEAFDGRCLEEAHARAILVPASINCRLLDHQREGVKFLYNLYKHNHGGVLGDDMGLGKTIQTIAFVAAVLQKDVEFENDFQTGTSEKAFGHKQTKKLVLIICPTSVLQNWENEFNEWGTFSVAIYHGVNKELVLRKIESGLIEIVLTSFDTFRIHGESLCYVDWEVVIIDEAHRLKNDRSQLYKACQKIKTRKCFGLTGTIMQNKIMDLFNVFDLVSPGCLGSREHFREFYDEPLKQGQRISAPERVVQIAEERKQDLLQVLRRYLLRRTKEETIGHLMRGKEDNVVFCAMSPLQKRVYKRLLESPDFKSLILKDLPCSCGSNLTRVECCHKTVPDGIIWSYLHRENPDGCESCPFCLVLPCLVKLQQVSNHLELIKPNPKDEPEKQKKDEALACSVFGKDLELVGGVVQDESFMGLSDVQHCGKMRALEKLMASWISHGDKVLLFSYSVRMLDILEKFLIRKGYCFSRLDGSTPMSNRQSLVDNFNQSPSKQVFLISTRAGGLGLNLISANRVVIFDPNWNPAQDLQAQDRSFRYGQRRHVTVFRLLAAGSLEELVYTRQIYKQQLFNIAVSGNLEKRYFEGVQDSKDFKGELFGICNLFRDLSNRLFTNEIVEQHEKRLESYGHFNVVRNNVGADKQTQMPPNNCEMSEPPGTRSMAEAEYQQVDTPVSFEQGGLTTMKETAYTDLPRITNILTDAGVMYVHRNEDVVNSRAHNQAEDTSVDPLELGTSIEPLSRKRQDSRLAAKGMSQKPNKLKNGSESLKHQSKERKVPATKRSSGRALQKMDKYKQYALLAKFRGMTELEFSKWLLSASSSEMERLLLEYKRCISKEEID